MCDTEDKKKPIPEADTGNGEPPKDEEQVVETTSDTGNGEPPPN